MHIGLNFLSQLRKEGVSKLNDWILIHTLINKSHRPSRNLTVSIDSVIYRLLLILWWKLSGLRDVLSFDAPLSVFFGFSNLPLYLGFERHLK